jgi:hypothetical protein
MAIAMERQARFVIQVVVIRLIAMGVVPVPRDARPLLVEMAIVI